MSHEITTDYLRAALLEIAKGMGRFSRDPLTHAENTIEDMRSIAHRALDGEWDPPVDMGYAAGGYDDAMQRSGGEE